MAAIRLASPRNSRNFGRPRRRAMLQFTAKTVYVDRPALAILAIVDHKARFPDLTGQPLKNPEP